MTQPELFTPEQYTPEWTRLSAPRDKCATLWRHRAGWHVEHCGHPTALYPYVAIDPDGRPFVEANGRGFRNLARAKSYVEERLKEQRGGAPRNGKGERSYEQLPSNLQP